MEWRDEIKDCPLCGGKPGVYVFIGQVAPAHWQISCVPCAIEMKHDRKDKVIFHWNQRTGSRQEWEPEIQEALISREVLQPLYEKFIHEYKGANPPAAESFYGFLLRQIKHPTT